MNVMLNYLPQIINGKTVINMTFTYAAGDDFTMRQNGDIQIRLGTVGIVEICERGIIWRRLCPNEYF